ncbi:LysR substrate-binding domain-containing protein [Sedimenticola hydrogenitrophicus]|uniref:LysR substrate-binding domain-containing protein n=1 Tax=Sedimenticola hydrogenitrophicus TaxID=2967975 RepID=UPI0021A8CC62|nr:LysR substrate-binding domain-containing protein [Sedimenticola hydrogenitrophicus]
MIGPRRFLPSLSSLLALEAVDRLGSASAAAGELALTHGAISRQLKVLETQLGVPLIQRDGNRLKLNPAAAEYCGIVRGLLQDLSRATLKLKANPTGGSLNLAILPAFGMHWLAPRLKDFADRHPEVSVNLSTRLKPFDFRTADFDAAIHFGLRDWPGVDYLPIADEQILPVCAPDLLTEPPSDPAALLRYPLLHLETRADAWEAWFHTCGIQVSGLRGMLFDQFSTMAQAAVHGLGIALLPSYLAQPEIRSGRLVCAHGEAVTSAGSYYLVWPNERPARAPLLKFAQWLEQTLCGSLSGG